MCRVFFMLHLNCVLIMFLMEKIYSNVRRYLLIDLLLNLQITLAGEYRARLLKLVSI